MSDLPPIDPALASNVAAEVLGTLARSGLNPNDPQVRIAILQALESREDRKLNAAEKRTAAIELRKAGASYREIARLVGYSGPGAAHKAVAKVFADMPKEGAEELRQLATERLETILAGGLFRKAVGGDLKAIDRVVRVMREQRRYVPGLEVPVNAEITGVGGGSIVVELTIPEPVPEAPVAQADLARLGDAAASGAAFVDSLLTTGRELDPSPAAGSDS